MYKLFTVTTLCLAVVVNSVAPAYARVAPASFADIVEKLTPAVVNISTTTTVKPTKRGHGGGSKGIPKGHPFEQFNELFKQFGNPNIAPKGRKATSLGSGFLIDPDGYIVTNNHVINGADEITVTFSDDSKHIATIVGKDIKTDLALLKIEKEDDKPFPFVKFGDSEVSRIGDWVIVIGNPFGLGGTVTAGIISARARDINAGPFDDFIQTDAPINRGNSGGPLFNLDGEVIGINTAIFSPNGAGNVGIGFAIPSSQASNIITQLKDSGSIVRGWLGVRIQHVTEDIAEGLGIDEETGALVAEVMENSPAEKAKFEVGDLILSFDGKEVSVMKRLPRIVAETPVGKEVDVKVLRDGEEKTLKVTVAKLDESSDDADEESDINGDVEGKELLGLYLKPLSDDLRSDYGIEEKVKGLLVTGVNPDSEAASRGVRKGDVILRMGREKVSTFSGAKKILEVEKSKGRKAVLLRINRSGERLFQALPIDEED